MPNSNQLSTQVVSKWQKVSWPWSLGTQILAGHVSHVLNNAKNFRPIAFRLKIEPIPYLIARMILKRPKKLSTLPWDQLDYTSWSRQPQNHPKIKFYYPYRGQYEFHFLWKKNFFFVKIASASIWKSKKSKNDLENEILL